MGGYARPNDKISSIQQAEIAFMMATPEKALADILISTRQLRIQSHGAMLRYLQDDLRLHEDGLMELNTSCFYGYAEHGYKTTMLNQLAKAIESLSND